MTFSSSRMLPGHGYCDERLGRVGLDALDLLAQALVELDEEVLDEERDVARALAQRRQADGHDVEPIEEVFAERPRPR